MGKKVNPLIAALEAAQGKATKPEIKTEPPAVTYFRPTEWQALVLAIVDGHPDLTIDTDAVARGGIGKTGLPIKLAVLKAGPDKGRGLLSRNVTLYGSGKAVWTNLAPLVVPGVTL